MSILEVCHSSPVGGHHEVHGLRTKSCNMVTTSIRSTMMQMDMLEL